MHLDDSPIPIPTVTGASPTLFTVDGVLLTILEHGPWDASSLTHMELLVDVLSATLSYAESILDDLHDVELNEDEVQRQLSEERWDRERDDEDFEVGQGW
jgi:hypothetical protein